MPLGNGKSNSDRTTLLSNRFLKCKADRKLQSLEVSRESCERRQSVPPTFFGPQHLHLELNKTMKNIEYRSW